MSRARLMTTDGPTRLVMPQQVRRSDPHAPDAAARRFFVTLAVVLTGYTLLGRGWAAIGVPPLYVGEMTLGLGVLAVLAVPLRAWRVTIVTAWPLLLFMGWGAALTLPGIATWGAEALRDAVVWGYGGFALIIIVLLRHDERSIDRAFDWFGRYARRVLLLAPVLLLASKQLNPVLPTIPGTIRPILDLKGGDIGVQIAGAFAYAVLCGGIGGWLAAWGVLGGMVVNVGGRAALLSIVAAGGIAATLRPAASSLRLAALVATAGLTCLFITDLKINPGGRFEEDGREISFEQFARNVASLVGQGQDESLDGTRTWRLQWWTKIVGYTFGERFDGTHFWTGKGFGVNLATVDGFQVEPDYSLRSPHNGHMTILARSGVPGLALWTLLVGHWYASVTAAGMRRARRHDTVARNRMAFLLAFMTAFLVNASFDVYLEGPIGGIWFWCVYGFGLVAASTAGTAGITGENRREGPCVS